ncbi:MAG TPA: FAD-dependent oxidoreductase [Acidimicrobiia bacterium]|nr:FAD-dependent oxidoreductase [Acidimicrobiia bacterium]
MTTRTTDVVVCGAGIAGVATAYLLATRAGLRVALCDPRPPLTLTSDKSTECYRNFWPNPAMVALMNRSIDLMEEVSAESGESIGLNRRGYLYVTASPDRLKELGAAAEVASGHGSGPMRRHGIGSATPYEPAPDHGWVGAPVGLDLIEDPAVLGEVLPGLSDSLVGGLHVRRAGWVSAQQMGAHMVERAVAAGAELIPHQVTGVDRVGGRVSAVRLSDGSTIGCGAFVNAAGPLLSHVAGLLGVTVPVHSEVHLKVAIRDTAGAMPRNAPLTILSDPQQLDWSDEERRHLEEAGREDLIDPMPAACHGRPEGGPDSPFVLALWEYARQVREPTWPIPQDPLYAEVVVRGMAALFPAFNAYRDRMPHTVVDGGYYTKTVENRPLAGPMGPEGAFLVGALSGFGVMAACGVADLVAAHLTGAALPPHAAAFQLDRYDNAAYREEIAALVDTGQI